MRRLLSFLLFWTHILYFEAQDTIVTREGEKIISKVIEVNPNNIRYKRQDNLEGPVYTLEKEKLSKISYLNGNQDTFDNYVAPAYLKENKSPDLTIQPAGRFYYYKGIKLWESDMHEVVKQLKDPKLNLLVRRTNNMEFVQEISLVSSVPLFISGAYIYGKNLPIRRHRFRMPVASPSQIQGQRIGVTLMAVALALDVVSLSFMFEKRKHNRLLVKMYNQAITSREH